MRAIKPCTLRIVFVISTLYVLFFTYSVSGWPGSFYSFIPVLLFIISFFRYLKRTLSIVDTKIFAPADGGW